jgi:hypothetical protein
MEKIQKYCLNNKKQMYSYFHDYTSKINQIKLKISRNSSSIVLYNILKKQRILRYIIIVDILR